MNNRIDLRSDTVTKPTPEMLEAMANAEVGDDCYGEDPTVNRLQAIAAARIGKEASLYVPSGTMGNTAAIMSHTQKGDMVIVDKESHIYYYEYGNLASLAGVMPIVLDYHDGCPDLVELEEYLSRPAGRFPRVGLVCLENTHNRRGGLAVSLERMREVCQLAHSYGVPVHLDGARIFNAAFALSVSAEEIAETVDSVMFCLSKGLAAPVGSMLAGDADFIERARVCRKRLGGAMRQAGVIAAAGIVALEKMVDRLPEDHENAAILAERLAHVDGIDVIPVDRRTNMVMLDTRPLGCKSGLLIEKAAERGLLLSNYGEYTVRMVTNKDVSRDQVLEAADIVENIVSEIKRSMQSKRVDV